MSVQCSLSGVKQTSRRKAATSAYDPERTSGPINNGGRFSANPYSPSDPRLLYFTGHASSVRAGTYEATRIHHASYWDGGMAGRCQRATGGGAYGRISEQLHD